MKNIKILILLVFMGVISSCDYLDVVPDNVATIDNAFTNKYNATKFLTTCYSYLPNYTSVSSNPALAAGDEIWYPDYYKESNFVGVAKGQQNSTNPMFNRWIGSYYVAIRDCNIFLEKVAGVHELNEYEKKNYVAEVNFLKAYYHFLLVRMYGPIVINDVNRSVTETVGSISVERQPVDACFDFIINTMDKAIVDLDLQLQDEATELGRITKPIAAAIKARVLMTAASPMFNGNQDFGTMKMADGTSLFNTTFDAGKWDKAAVACKEAIDLCHEAGIRLYKKDDYRNAFDQNEITLKKAALRGAITERWSMETIWGSTRSVSGIQFSSCPRLYPCTTNPVNSNHCPTLRIAEMYYSENGVPIEEDNSYDYDNRFKLKTAKQEDRFFVEPGEQTAILNFSRELRFYANLSFDRGTWFGNGKETSDEDPWYIHSRQGEFASIFERWAYSVTGYWPKKLVSIKSQIKAGTSFTSEDYFFPIIRLADLYLYYAEALNETKSAPDAAVYEYIDLVRERAHLEGVVSSWSQYSKNSSKPTTKSGMRDIIHRERLIEMAFEGGRFWDLRRWKLAKEYLSKPIRGWNVLKNDSKEYYTINVLYNQRFDQKDYLWPISEGAILNNPALVQNPGW